MSKIFLTGDTHGGESGDMKKINSREWPKGNNLSKSDYLIILGDFGFVWGGKSRKRDLHVQKWLKEKPWTTLVIDGNHENHDLLGQLETKEMFGNRVGVINDSIFLLKRGEIYNINEKSFFCMGGAESIDKEHRELGITWWPQEIPSYREMDKGLESLSKYKWEVDYILTHTCPNSIGQTFISMQRPGENMLRCPVGNYLDHIYKDQSVSYKKWFFGHWHSDWDYEKFSMLYQRVVELV